MFTFRKIALSALGLITGLAGLFFVAAPGAVLGDGAGNPDVAVVADSPWDSPQP